MARFQYEIDKALKETGLTIEAVKAAFKLGNSGTVKKFMSSLQLRVHGEAVAQALELINPTKKAIVLSGDKRIDRALRATNIDFDEAKHLTRLYYGGADRAPTEAEISRCFAFTSEMRKHMSLDAAKHLIDEWGREGANGMVKSAKSAGWVRSNCKFTGE